MPNPTIYLDVIPVSSTTIVVGGTLSFTVVARDSNGKSLAAPQPITVTINDPTLGTVSVNPDGTNGLFTSSGIVGTAIITPHSATSKRVIASSLTVIISGAPAVPTNVDASDATDSFVAISWDAAARATTYNVYRSTTVGQQGALLASSIAALSTSDVTAAVGQIYYYGVVAVNQYGSSALSTQDAGSVAVPAPPPPPTGGLTFASSNPTGETIDVYQPADNASGRVWITAPLRAANDNYFSKWQKDGVDFDTASTTSFIPDGDATFTAVYLARSTAGVQVSPGTDTLAAAMVGKPAGTTYLLLAGVHRFTDSVLPLVGDTIQGEQGAYVRGCVVTAFTPSGGHWAATGQTQDFYVTYGDANPAACLPSSPLCYRRELVFFNGTQLTPVGSLGALASGKFFFDYAADTIYIADDPTGAEVEVTNGSGALIGFGGSNINVTVRNLIFERFGGGLTSPGERHDIIKAVDGWLVEGCEIRYTSAIGIVGYYTATIRNNYIHHCGQHGLVGRAALWEGNVVTYNNTAGFDPNTDGAGTKFSHSTNMVVRGNSCLNNNGNGIWSDFDNKGATYENNIIRNNAWGGIDNEVNCFATVRYNVFDSNNAANAGKSLYFLGQIYSSNSRDLEIYGNDITVGSGTHGVSIRGDVASKTTAQCGTYANSNVSVHDNVIRLATGSQHGYCGLLANATTTTFTNNAYTVPSLSGAYFMFGDGTTVKTFAQWQAAGHDVGGSVTQA